MLQKGGDGIFSSSKVFGIRGRSSTIIRITYVLCGLFLMNNIILGILYKRAHKDQLIETQQKPSFVGSSDANEKQVINLEKQLEKAPQAIKKN